VGVEVKQYLTSLRYAGYRFKGFVTLGEPMDGTGGVPEDLVLGDVSHVIPLARALFVDEIIFTRRPSTRNVLSSVIESAQNTGVDVRLIPSLSETLRNRKDVQYLEELPTITIYQRKRRSVALLVKRGMDITLATAGLLLILPLLVAIAIKIKISSKGPVFYRSKRVGYKGNIFTCYKFRTMMQGADKMLASLAHLNEREGVLFKMTNDPRITPFGAFLRRYSLDELPQLFNVIKGDMSLVGPRPSISTEVAQYKNEHLRRLDVVPGITGLWQVEARNDPSFDKYIVLDSKYVSDWSIWLDASILLRTVRAVFMGTGS
jgi:exopolysaccharide biosynthesis polyprenyl glycosylphosphotransferase